MNVRDWLYVEDHARALLAVALDGKVGETYCIGGRNALTNLDVVKAICAVMDRACASSDGGAKRRSYHIRRRSARP